MICCLNPDCPSPENPDQNEFCQSCGVPLVRLLRGHYRITKLLSDEGGFGRTYLAEDLDKLDELCVVKQLAPKVQGTWAIKKAVELFKEEAKRLQELGEHPQIPTLLAYFEEDNYLYLVQQFINGENLFKELEKLGKFSETQIRELLLDLLPVLQYIHERGVIHRDIKPQNIIRRSPPVQGRELTLIDFGASKQLTVTVQPEPGTTIGSHGYSPLEQIQHGEAYPASDLFSLGASCFHLLTGITPFQLWSEHGYSWVNNWRKYLTSPISWELTQVIDKLLKKDIQDRYQSAVEILEDLRKPVAPPPPPTQPIPPPIIKLGKAKSTKAQSAKTKSAKTKSAQQVPLIPRPTPPQTTVSLRQKKEKKLLPLLLTSSAIASLAMVLAGIGYWQFHHHQQTANLTNTTVPKSQSQPTSLESFVLAETLTGHSGVVRAVAVSPNGKIMVSGSADKTIKLWNLANREAIRTLNGHKDWVVALAISPDSTILASGSSDKTIKLWNLETGELIATLKGHKNWVSSLAFSPDGKTLASASADETVKLWNVKTLEEIRSLKGHTNDVNTVTISPDGKTIASGSFRDMKLWNLANGVQMRTIKGHNDWVMSLAFSPDGKTLASGSSDKKITLWNTRDAAPYRVLDGHSKEVFSVAFSPDGQTLASGSGDSTVKLWNLATAEEIRTLTGHGDIVYSVAFTPDGKSVISGSKDNTIKIWQLSR
ncbi:MAG: protein kinase [Nostocaceae cyanobacterium]|nr:protein kinase [Nostocaceae cyanobacterium]